MSGAQHAKFCAHHTYSRFLPMQVALGNFIVNNDRCGLSWIIGNKMASSRREAVLWTVPGLAWYSALVTTYEKLLYSFSRNGDSCSQGQWFAFSPIYFIRDSFVWTPLNLFWGGHISRMGSLRGPYFILVSCKYYIFLVWRVDRFIQDSFCLLLFSCLPCLCAFIWLIFTNKHSGYAILT